MKRKAMIGLLCFIPTILIPFVHHYYVQILNSYVGYLGVVDYFMGQVILFLLIPMLFYFIHIVVCKKLLKKEAKSISEKFEERYQYYIMPVLSNVLFLTVIASSTT